MCGTRMRKVRLTTRGKAVIFIGVVIIAVLVVILINKNTSHVENSDGEDNSVNTEVQTNTDNLADEKSVEIEELKNKIKIKDKKIERMEDVFGQSSCSIYFESKNACMNKMYYPELNMFVKWAEMINNRKIVIEGNVYAPKDKEGKAYGLKFSEKRAEAVAEYLIKQGVQRDRIIIIGNGASKPVYFEKGGKAKELNRRVDVYFQ
jgi:outer membrane protein OmpA-like peptidoglycan-associated protein